ncbi:MAG TPA: hypothetical protein VIA45_01265 [Thermoanaerobaculia bacterium]|jgi:hypothetical protein
MTSKLPTDPLADASTGVVRRSRGAFLKTVPEKRPDRRNPNRQSNYTGPERRRRESKPGKPIFGLPRWIVIAGGIYLAVLALALVLVFTY